MPASCISLEQSLSVRLTSLLPSFNTHIDILGLIPQDTTQLTEGALKAWRVKRRGASLVSSFLSFFPSSTIIPFTLSKQNSTDCNVGSFTPTICHRTAARRRCDAWPRRLVHRSLRLCLIYNSKGRYSGRTYLQSGG